MSIFPCAVKIRGKSGEKLTSQTSEGKCIELRFCSLGQTIICATALTYHIPALVTYLGTVLWTTNLQQHLMEIAAAQNSSARV